MIHPYNYWNYERCSAEAKKYVKRSHFKNACASAYGAARKNGWLDSICSHMELTLCQKRRLWSNLKECRKESKKYKNRSEFFAGNKVAYSIAEENGWIDSFYPTTAIKHGWWNDKERCKQEALKYKTRTEFCKKSNGAYAASIKNGWLDDICSHMIVKWEKKWASKETCLKEAIKYKTRAEFQRESDGAYTYALRHGFLDEICEHMELAHVVKWNSKEACHKEAMKYNTRKEFQMECDGAYTYALRHGFLDEICSHMEVYGNFFKRCIYAFEFSDNYVYVGLTCNLRRRERDHLSGKRSAVYRHIQDSGIIPHLIIVHDYVEKERAKELEAGTLWLYKEKGWNTLNRAKTGAMGALPKKWTKERCMLALKKCHSLAEFKSCYSSAYYSCQTNNWLDEVYQLYPENYTIEDIRKEASKYKYREDFWRYSRDAYNSAMKQGVLSKVCAEYSLIVTNDEESIVTPDIQEQKIMDLKAIAQKYQTKKAFKKGDKAAYNKACRMQVLQLICSHMKKPRIWTTEECAAIALKYNQRSDFRKNDKNAYDAARDHGWLDIICAHMPKPTQQKIWTKEECAIIAKKYNERSKFRMSNQNAYHAAREHGWLDEICAHMPKPILPKKWTKEECAVIAKKCSKRSEMMSIDRNAYNAARINGWLDEICAHMSRPKHKDRFYWTKEKCQEKALLYKHRVDFKTGDGSAYTTAVAHGWLDEICSHMTRPASKRKWTKEMCHQVALKYKTAKEFRQKERSVYATARNFGWLDEICSHLIFTSKRGLGRKYKI